MLGIASSEGKLELQKLDKDKDFMAEAKFG